MISSVPRRLSMTNESAGTVAAAGAVVSPWWLPSLHNVSVVAAELAPILGVIYLVVQIYLKIVESYKKDKNEQSK